MNLEDLKSKNQIIKFINTSFKNSCSYLKASYIHKIKLKKNYSNLFIFRFSKLEKFLNKKLNLNNSLHILNILKV